MDKLTHPQQLRLHAMALAVQILGPAVSAEPHATLTLAAELAERIEARLWRADADATERDAARRGEAFAPDAPHIQRGGGGPAR